MSNEVMNNKIGSHYKPPIKGKILKGRAISPFSSLAHHIDFMGVLRQLGGQRFQLDTDLLPGLFAQPVFKTS